MFIVNSIDIFFMNEKSVIYIKSFMHMCVFPVNIITSKPSSPGTIKKDEMEVSYFYL